MSNHYNLAFVEPTPAMRWPRRAQGMSDEDFLKLFPKALPIYYSPVADAEAMWSGSVPLPEIGDRVHINFNQFGDGVVESYFIEDQWLGVTVRLDKEPEWRKKRDISPTRHEVAMVFGLEIELRGAVCKSQ